MKPPMSEARRQQIHGPLQTNLPPINLRREIIGTGLSLLFFCAMVLFFAAVTEEPGERHAVEVGQ